MTAPTRVYTRADLEPVRTDEVRGGDLLAHGRALELGDYTATRVALAGPTTRRKEWGDQDVARIETTDGAAYQQPAHWKVLIVKREIAR